MLEKTELKGDSFLGQMVSNGVGFTLGWMQAGVLQDGKGSELEDASGKDSFPFLYPNSGCHVPLSWTLRV